VEGTYEHGFHKILRIPGVAKRLAVYQDGLSSMKIVVHDFRPQRLSSGILYIHNQFPIKSVDWPIFILPDFFCAGLGLRPILFL
jgi:hypothetical protein